MTVTVETLRAECEKLGVPVRVDDVITASGLSALLDHGSSDTVRKWRDTGDGPRYRIAPWRGHRYTYSLADVAAYLNAQGKEIDVNRNAAE
jgi:hypothetical protein